MLDIQSLIGDMERQRERPSEPPDRRQPLTDPATAWELLRLLSASQEIEVTDEHRYAYYRIVVQADNAFLTGGAGVGKTTFLKLLIAALTELNVRVAVTATTGIAGSHLEGRTIHSWAGIGLGPFFPSTVSPVDMTLDRVGSFYQDTYDKWLAKSRNPQTRGYIAGVTKRIKFTDVLVMDEVSMCHGVALLDYLDFFFRHVREVDLPFGGLQMLFAGDFGQLPPVEKKAGTRPDWAFLSRSWSSAQIREIELTKVFRQADVEFANYLNRRRVGIPMTPEERAYTRRFVRDVPDAITKSHLVTTNDKAERINDAALLHFPGQDIVIDATFRILPHQIGKDETVSSVRQRLLRGTIMRERLKLRPGFPVLMTVNSEEFVNGTKGVFDSYDPVTDQMKVRLHGSALTTSITRVCKTAAGEDPDALTKLPGSDEYVPMHARMEQFPVIPAVAITAHKSQGMSLNDCVVDMSRTFAPGQVYVAVSRVRSPEGLYLVTPDFEAQVCPYVLRYYADAQVRMRAGMEEFSADQKAGVDLAGRAGNMSPPSYEHSETQTPEGSQPPEGNGSDHAGI